MFSILVINPGSTSTKIALFQDDREIFTENLFHSTEVIAQYPNIAAQFDFRQQAIEEVLSQKNISIETIDCFVGRGGLLRPIPSGTYRVDEAMLQDLQAGMMGEHASNLGAILAHKLASIHGKPAFIVDPVVVDEMEPLARLSGHPLLPRKSIFHALNHKAVGRKAAEKLGAPYHKVNLIIAHLGGGISVAAHCQGRVIDVNNALDGEGPYSPERTGTLPAGDLMRLCFSGKYSLKEVGKMIKGQGGVVAYLGVNDMRQVAQRIKEGDAEAEVIYRGMAYQVAKEIGALAAVLKGDVDAIVLTGGIAYDTQFVGWVREHVAFIAPVMAFPGEEEMKALALGALRVLNGAEEAKDYLTNQISST